MIAPNPFWEAGQALLSETGCRVRSYRENLSGRAYTSRSDWSIDVPRPTTARRFATFAHEVGHQLLHRKDRGRRKLTRWQEEAEAWAYALGCFDRFDLPGAEHAHQDAIVALAYKAYKIAQRGNPDCASYTRPPQPYYVEQVTRWLEIAAVTIEGDGAEWTAHDMSYIC